MALGFTASIVSNPIHSSELNRRNAKMTNIIIMVICLAAGVFAGYHIGLTPGATFVEKAKFYMKLK
jgi:hypothetical protein